MVFSLLDETLKNIRLSHHITMSKKITSIVELEKTKVIDPDTSEEVLIQRFLISYDGIKVELCSLGASIIRFVLPSGCDVVLSYKSPKEMWETTNPAYLGAVVGRVANRIARGEFSIDGKKKYVLKCNNGPNHLHGGPKGFSTKNWKGEILDNVGVKFTYESPDGEEGYPGSLKVSSVYMLSQSDGKNGGVTLKLKMCASLIKNGDKQAFATPINLAQHSYFNLAGHDSEEGVLNHSLHTPNAFAYTPTDHTCIPTKMIKYLKDDSTMDFRGPKKIRWALNNFAQHHLGMGAVIEDFLEKSRTLNQWNGPGQPWGIDHNYLLKKPETASEDSLSVAAILQHGNRKLTVLTDAPGMQVYTAHYLAGEFSSYRDTAKDQAKAYSQPWQAICLETQCIPDSILPPALENELESAYLDAKCHILRNEGEEYQHNVWYQLDY